MSSLLIVESPTKARTISRFLGSGYLVRSSFGHIRDLPKSSLGVDVEHNFKPKYVVPPKAKKVIAELKEAVSKSTSVILATDEDREGEAIAWHLSEVLGLGNNKSQTPKVKRIVFHEITKPAIEEALKNPRGIDMNLVDAQQARRVLDRLVGYELSPFLWKKIRPGLSAGRVQSVALRLVVEREREIQNFKSQEFWTIEADLAKKEGNGKFHAKLIKIGDKELGKLDIKSEDEVQAIIKDLKGVDYKVANIVRKEALRYPSPPFTTSTLQQEAFRKLGMSAKQTMMVAQRLYETGLITYMRTDSVNLAESALAQARSVISKNFGKEYLPAQPRRYITKSKSAQEAHEAIRPTDLAKTPDLLKGEVDSSGLKLYGLIWKRTLASQMQPAVFDQTTVDVLAGQNHTFRAIGQVMKFDGFIRAYTEGHDEGNGEEIEGRLPELSVGEILELIKLQPFQRFTEPPPRYTDATLVKALESYGIGRPSTYAPILATIQERGYVERFEKRFKPTEIGFLVNDMLVENFPEIVDVKFTSRVEDELDDIAQGKTKWVPVVEDFYRPFKKRLLEKEASVEKFSEETDTTCPKCGKKMVIRLGRSGKFLACPDVNCKTTLPLPEEAAKIKELEEKTKDERCPLCGKKMKVRRSRFGYFLSCVDYPKCRGTLKILEKTGFKCPECKVGDLVQRKARGRIFFSCSRYPDCTFITSKKPANEAELEEIHKKWKARSKNQGNKGGLKKSEK